MYGGSGKHKLIEEEHKDEQLIEKEASRIEEGISHDVPEQLVANS